MQEDLFTEDLFTEILPEELGEVASAQDSKEQAFLDMQNVVGVGIGMKIKDGVDTGKASVTVLVTHKVEDEAQLSSDDRLPKTIKDVPTDVIEVGEIFAGDGDVLVDDVGTSGVAQDVTTLSLTQRERPAKGGYSIGHHRITAGTAATGCYDLSPFPSEPRRYYILSNNHVLANSNDARIGDPILQPGPADGGTFPSDFIGRLARFVPIRFGLSGVPASRWPCNYVDAAIAETRFEWFDRQIYYIGNTASLGVAASVGQIVKKTGRTTNFTTGRVRVLNATINVNYGAGRVARFCRQIVTTDMSAPGDSGSLVLDQRSNPVGLLFAGSAVATILNPINFVQGLLRVRLWP